MCGIVGILGSQNVAVRLVEGLKRLEYRGYDSAGIATIDAGEIKRCRAQGKIANLEVELQKSPIYGDVGIGHTRWATHGKPNEINAHPHATGKVAVVHNGIIENFAEIRAELEGKDVKFYSETDTEVIPQLITYLLSEGNSPQDAVKQAISRLKGAYALGVIFSAQVTAEKLLVAARYGSPLAIGYGSGDALGEFYIGSDAIALATLTNKISYLEDGDLAFITEQGVTIYDRSQKEAEREIVTSSVSDISVGKENYNHFMQKEIYEQPSVIGDVLHAYHNSLKGEVTLPEIPFSFNEIERVSIVACGTSYYAGFIAKYWFENVANIAVDIEFASEFRYRNVIFPKNGVAVFVSQSGETADTLAALRYAKANGQKIIAVVNVSESTMAREADIVLPTYSGPEIGVASTKAFTTQLATLACLVTKVAKDRQAIDKSEEKNILRSISEIPSRMAEVLNHDEAIRELSHELARAQDILYIGRGVSYGLAMEGALKLKEISYIHAEATAAGELKHGVIALVDENVPIIAIAPSDELFDKTASNIREVAARGGKIILLSDKQGIDALKDVVYYSINLPESGNIVSPILYAIPIQLIAYHVAVIKGTDVDQPRNLAKSVTVE